MTQTGADTHEFLTVKELAELLRIKERKVYDLAASGEVPCSRATGKLLFPAVEIRAWIDHAKSGGTAAPLNRPDIFLGSHDPLLDWAIRQSRCGLATYFDGSHDGLSRFQNGEGIATGLHIFDAESGSWNLPDASRVAQGQNTALVHFVSRQRGIVFRPDGPRPESIAGLKGMRIAPRQPESGTAGLFERLARDAGLDPSELSLSEVARSEDDAVQMVRHGEADVTFGLQSVAESYGLGFLPVIEERYDLLIDRKAWFDPPMQTLLEFCRSDAFRQRAASFHGYDLSDLGKVAWNA